MRLGTLATNGATAAVVITDDAAAVTLPGYADAGAVLRAGARGLDDARRGAASGRPLAYRAEDLVRPVLDPGAVVCVGLNFRTHILEMGRELPEHPTLFAKYARALTDPYAPITLPRVASQPDYEGELVIVIGRSARRISEDDAYEAVAGYTVMNDVSMRDFQYRTLQWFAGKNFEHTTPVGPWIVTPDEVGDLAALRLEVRVNGEVRQRASFADLVFDIARLVADLSWIITLEPGDMIATGTPGGVGYGMNPKIFLRGGDVVEVEIDGIGTLRNEFVDE